MKVMYNFSSYIKPRKALYAATDGVNEVMVIGEADSCYVTELVEHVMTSAQTVLLPVGFHKSRLLRWVPMVGDQLLLWE